MLSNTAIEYLALNAPWLGVLRRAAFILRDTVTPARASYSQHGEDVWLYRALEDYDLSGGIYIDVGASHPTRINNTYLFYRCGHHGLLVEPNMELALWLRLARPRDTCIHAACGARSDIGTLCVQGVPVLGSLVPRGRASTTRHAKTEPVAIVPLDSLNEIVPHDWVYLLSIDAEGYDCDVLRGATRTLGKTLYVCVEAFTSDTRAEIESVIGQQFEVCAELGCNLLCRNRDPELQTAHRRQKDVRVRA